MSFVELHPQLFAGGIVGFANVDRDFSFRVAGVDDLILAGIAPFVIWRHDVCLKVERKLWLGAGVWQTKSVECVEESAFRCFEPHPLLTISGDRHVWDCLGKQARRAQPIDWVHNPDLPDPELPACLALARSNDCRRFRLNSCGTFAAAVDSRHTRSGNCRGLSSAGRRLVPVRSPWSTLRTSRFRAGRRGNKCFRRKSGFRRYSDTFACQLISGAL